MQHVVLFFKPFSNHNSKMLLVNILLCDCTFTNAHLYAQTFLHFFDGAIYQLANTVPV